MPILAGLIFVIQLTFVIHAIKSGRPYWWIFVIMGFPMMGCLIYYFIEIFPGSREHRKVHKAARKMVKALQPDADLKRRAEELEICGSVDNKIAMAKECVEHQMFSEAIALYESCLQGTYANDREILLGLARAAVEGGNWIKASVALDRLKINHSGLRAMEAKLLQARVMDGRGDTDAALSIYRELVPVFVGQEARYRYGEMLSRLGQHEAANHVFNEIIKHAKRFSSTIDDEQQWIHLARKAISNS